MQTDSGKSFYLRGWKGLSEFTGFSVRALLDWHYKKARVPFLRIGQKHARLVITREGAHAWLALVASVKPEKQEAVS